MTVAPVERRRITLLGDAGAVDLAVPADDRLDEALHRWGLALDPRAQRIVDRDGRSIDPATSGAQLADGGVYAVISVGGSRSASEERRERRAAERERTDHGARWILLGLVPVLAVVIVSLVAEDSAARLAVAAVLGVAALAPAVAWAVRSGRPGGAPPIAMAAPLALAGVAVAALIPGDLMSSGQLRITVGVLAAAVLALVLAVCTADAPLRAAWSTVSVLLVGLAGVWGGALLLQLPIGAAAAVSLGLVPVVLRALPTTLVNVSDGMFIDYRHFMSNRWSVRGSIPDSPASIAMADAERVVRASTARLNAGTLVLALVTVGMVPLAAPQLVSDDALIAVGTIVLFVCVVLALLLTPRHTTGRALRWLPRSAAIVALLFGAATLAAGVGAVTAAVVGAGVFAAGVVAAVVSVVVARGSSSLAWSRFGDVVEWLAVALALPAALIAADSIELLRGMMSG